MGRNNRLATSSEEPLDENQLPHPSQPRLLRNGECNPLYAWANISDYGFSCPRKEYTDSLEVPCIVKLSEKWGVSARSILSWRKDGRWVAIRGKKFKEIEDEAWALSRDKIAKMQVEEIETQLRNWKQQREALNELQRRGGYEKQSATGKKDFLLFDPKDHKDIIAALDKCDENIRLLLGMSKALIKNDDSFEAESATPVRRKIVYNFRGTAAIEEGEPAPAQLPEPAQIDNSLPSFVDGEVVEQVTERIDNENRV